MTDTRNVLVVGALGRMGDRVRAAVAQEPSLEVASALEAPGHPGVGSSIENGVRVTDDPKAALAGCDVAIDFAVPQATLVNLRAAADAGVAFVTGTTGFDPDQLSEISELAQRIPVIHAPNFSVSVNVLIWLVEEASRKLGTGYDCDACRRR